MIALLFVIFSWAVYLGFGMVLSAFLLGRKEKHLSLAAQLPFWFLFGAGAGTVLQFLLSLLRIPLALSFWLMAFVALAGFWGRRKHIHVLKEMILRSTLSNRVLSALLAIILIIFFIRSYSLTIYVWDGIAFWMPKVYALWSDQVVTPTTFIEFNHPEYPLLLPYVGANIFTLLGEPQETAIKAALFGFTIALVAALAQFISERHIWYTTFFFLAMFCSIFIFREHVAGEYVGTADILVGTYIGTGALFMLRGKVKHAIALWALVPWTKSEGLVWAGSSLGLIFLFYPHMRKLAVALGTALTAPWMIYTKVIGLSASQYFQFDQLYTRPWVEYAVYSVHAFREEFRNLQKWNLLFYFFFAAIATHIRAILRDKALLITLGCLAVQLGMYMYIFTITPEEQATFIAAAVSRLTLHLAPAVLGVTAYVFTKEYDHAN